LNNLIYFTSPFIEEIYYTGIIFNFLWMAFSNNLYLLSSKKTSLKTALIPFLITWYWFLLAHLYQTDFLNSNFSLLHKISSFPVQLFIVFSASIFLFIKTRSLIFPILCHYIAN